MKTKKNKSKFELTKLTVNRLENNADSIKGGTSFFGCVSILASCLCTVNTIPESVQLTCYNCPGA